MTTETKGGSVQTPALENLLGAYFHQDWFDEHGDEWATLDDFIDGEPALAPLLPGEIRQLLAEHADEASLEARLFSLGSCYVTSPTEGGYRGWLTEIARRVTAALPPHNR